MNMGRSLKSQLRLAHENQWGNSFVCEIKKSFFELFGTKNRNSICLNERQMKEQSINIDVSCKRGKILHANARK